jgi:hypothetical protein
MDAVILRGVGFKTERYSSKQEEILIVLNLHLALSH